MHRSTKNGVTIIELLVCAGVLSIVLSLLLPAVQHARESARAVHCQNNLHQIGLALQSHEASFGHLPGGGWGYAWVADPVMSSGPKQPGGWIAQMLPFAEHHMMDHNQLESNLAKPIALFSCPSKPIERLTPYEGQVRVRNASNIGLSFRSDYAGNGGDRELASRAGPLSKERRVFQAYVWRHRKLANGIFYQGSWTGFTDIIDGTSNTLMVAEKYVCLDSKYRDLGDDQAALIGDDHDIRRWTAGRMRHDARIPAPEVFGSSHSFGCNSLLCDGSVKRIEYSIDKATYQRLGSRNGHEAP